MKEIVEIKNLWVYFNDVPVLEDINWSINDRDFLALIGPNGGGKSTLLRCILGLVKPDKGKIKVFGKTPENGRGSIGYLPQSKPIDLSFPINVYDVVLTGRYDSILQPYMKNDHKATEKALKDVGMLENKDRQIGRLSGGEIQRVFLARAIVREPKLLLLDEPTSSIDPESQKSFYNMLAGLKEEMAIVMVTHDVGAVSSYFENVVCLNRHIYSGDVCGSGIGGLEETYHHPVQIIKHEKEPVK